MPKKSPKITPEQLAELLKAIANPIRFRIIDQLGQEGELTSGAIRDHLGVSQSLTSYNLSRMMESGLLIRTTRSTENFYSLADPILVDCIALAQRIGG